MTTTNFILHHQDLGQGSYFQSGLQLNFDDHTFQEWAAFTCNCSEEAMLERWATNEYEDHWEDPEEIERLLLHDQLVDEYLRQYSQDPNISGLTFTEWAETCASPTPESYEDEEKVEEN